MALTGGGGKRRWGDSHMTQYLGRQSRVKRQLRYTRLVVYTLALPQYTLQVFVCYRDTNHLPGYVRHDF